MKRPPLHPRSCPLPEYLYKKGGIQTREAG
jgi:hypothetical protein